MMHTNNDNVRSMFSIFDQHNMFLIIEIDSSLLKLPEEILKSLIRPIENV